MDSMPEWLRETIRKTLHIGVVVLAFPHRWWGWWYGLLFAAAAFIWNAYGMPRYFKFTFRPEENKVGYSKGMLSYPVSVFILIIIFPLPIAISQWAALSIGDGFATLFGRFLGKRKLPYSKDKTYAGSLSFLIMASFGSFFFFWWTQGNAEASSFLWAGSPLLDTIVGMGAAEVFLVCVLSTAVAAFVESLPIPFFDDNITAPLMGAIAKLLLCYLL